MKAEPLKGKKDYDYGRYINIFKEEDVKKAVKWLREWKLFTKAIPHKEICFDCKKEKAIWFAKDIILCMDCLLDEAFEDLK